MFGIKCIFDNIFIGLLVHNPIISPRASVYVDGWGEIENFLIAGRKGSQGTWTNRLELTKGKVESGNRPLPGLDIVPTPSYLQVLRATH